jgi:hypothetical protein
MTSRLRSAKPWQSFIAEQGGRHSISGIQPLFGSYTDTCQKSQSMEEEQVNNMPRCARVERFGTMERLDTYRSYVTEENRIE